MDSGAYELLKRDLSAIYEGHSTEGISIPNLMSDAEISALIDDLIQQIFKDQSIANAPKDLQQEFIDRLTEAVIKGYGGDVADFNMDTPDRRMIENLKQDVIRFSSAKD